MAFWQLLRKAKELWSWYSFAVGATTLVAGACAVVIAWLSTTWGWYWQTFSWAGVAFAFLAAWLIIAFGVFLIGIGVTHLRGRSKQEPKPPTVSPFQPGGRFLFESTSPSGVLSWNPDRKQGGPIEWNVNFGRTYNSDHIYALQLSGVNQSDASVFFKAATISSRITGNMINMKADLGSEGKLAPDEINPIPPHAIIRLVAQINPPDGLEMRDFLDEWKELDFTARYDETIFRLHFTEAVMKFQFPGILGPRVTKKGRK
jgi:hypothetical protein